MIREKIIRTKVKEMEERLVLVEEHLPEGFEEFSKMGLVRDGIYKNVEFCIQQVIDICSIINSDLELGVPSDEGEILENLKEEKILNSELFERIKRMRGFRNVLVHQYGRIDDELAFENIRDGLEDFQHFVDEVENFLSEQE